MGRVVRPPPNFFLLHPLALRPSSTTDTWSITHWQLLKALPSALLREAVEEPWNRHADPIQKSRQAVAWRSTGSPATLTTYSSSSRRPKSCHNILDVEVHCYETEEAVDSQTTLLVTVPKHWDPNQKGDSMSRSVAT